MLSCMIQLLAPPHSPVSRLSLFLSLFVSPVEITQEEGGRGWGRSLIIGPQESLALYKPFNAFKDFITDSQTIRRTERKLVL
jgi:hypothetical protein